MNSPHPAVVHTVTALVEAFAGTPWRVEYKTEDTVVLTLDVVNAQWWEHMLRAGWKTVYTFEVAFDPQAMTCTVTDIRNELAWDAGVDRTLVPRLTAMARTEQGRVISFQRSIVWTPSDGKVVDVTFSSEENRARLRQVLTAHEWKEKWGVRQRIGIAAAVFGGVVALMGAAVAIIVSL